MRKKSRLGTAAAAPKRHTIADYTLDDVESDVSHLCHLLDITVNGLCGNTIDSDEIRVERATALAWVARDLAETIKQNLEEGGGQPRSLATNAA